MIGGLRTIEMYYTHDVYDKRFLLHVMFVAAVFHFGFPTWIAQTWNADISLDRCWMKF